MTESPLEPAKCERQFFSSPDRRCATFVLLLIGVLGALRTVEASTAEVDRRHLKTNGSAVVRELVTRFAQADSPPTADGDGDESDRQPPNPPTTQITGLIIDEAGSPVPGAEVVARVDEHAYRGRSGPEGRFEISVPIEQARFLHLYATSADFRLAGTHRNLYGTADASPVQLMLKPALHIDVHVVDEVGQPVAGAQVVGRGDSYFIVNATTNAEGIAQLFYAGDNRVTITQILAWKPGLGLNFQSLPRPDYRNFSIESLMGRSVEQLGPFTLALQPARPYRMQVRDKQTGEPVANARLGIWQLKRVNGATNSAEDLAITYGVPELHAVSDVKGNGVFDWFPDWFGDGKFTVSISAPGYCELRLPSTRRDNEITVAELEPLVEVRGRLLDPEGHPAGNVAFELWGRGLMRTEPVSAATRDYTYSVTTNADGTFSCHVAPYAAYFLGLSDRQWSASAETPLIVYPGASQNLGDLTLIRAIRVRANLTAGDPPRPVPRTELVLRRVGSQAEIVVNGNEAIEQRIPIALDHVWTDRTDEQGVVQYFVPPGQYELADGRPQSADNFGIPKSELELTFGRVRIIDLHLPIVRVLNGQVVDGDPPAPVPGIGVRAIPLNGRGDGSPRTITDADGRFTILRPLGADTALVVDDGQSARVGMLHVHPDDFDVTLKLGPPGVVRGRLLQDDGTPLANTPLSVGVQLQLIEQRPNGGRTTSSLTNAGGSYGYTNERGEFTLQRLLPGELHYLFQLEEHPAGFRSSRIGIFMSNLTGDPIDVGDIRAPAPYVPRTGAATFDERYLANFESFDSPQVRFDQIMKKQRLGHVRTLVTLGQPEHPEMREFYLLRLEDVDLQNLLMQHYRTLALSTTWEEGELSKEIARKLKLDLPADGAPVMAVLDDDEQVIARIDVDDWKTDGQPDGKKANAIFEALKFPPLDANLLFQKALLQAQHENKRVLLVESTVWRGPWDLMFYLDRMRETLEKDYVIVFTDERWLNHEAVMRQYRGERPGLPWMCILDASGTLLADSEGPLFSIRYPDSQGAVEHLMEMFRSTRQRLTDDDLLQLKQQLYPEFRRQERIDAVLRGPVSIVISASNSALDGRSGNSG